MSTRGSKESGIFNSIFTGMKLVTLTFTAILAYFYFKIENYEPFFLEEQGGWAGTVKGATILFFAMLGFDSITTFSEESKNARRDVPRAIEITITACCGLYCILAGGLSGMTKLQVLPPETAMAHAF